MKKFPPPMDCKKAPKSTKMKTKVEATYRGTPKIPSVVRKRVVLILWREYPLWANRSGM
jgi:hypothetical protein